MFVGHVSIDHVANPQGIKIQAGGAALYAALAARTLLSKVTLVSAIGNDYPFMDTLNLLTPHHVRTLSMPSTEFHIKYNQLGEGEYLRSTYGAGAKITAATIPTQLLAPETIVHIAPMHPRQVNNIVHKIRKASPNTRIAINTWVDYIKMSRRNRRMLTDLASDADFFMLNDHEAKALTETSSLSTVLTRLNAKLLIITLGELGAIIRGGNGAIQMVPALNRPSRRVVDTTGAGDVWCGAFVAAYKLTDDLMKVVTIASILSSMKCSGWNFQKLINLRFRRPDDVIEYVIGLKEGALQKRIPDFTRRTERD